MLDSITSVLDQVGSLSFWICITLLVAIDVIAAAAVIQTRSRELVNRWTGRILAANLVLLGAGLGVPVVAYTTRMVVVAVAPMVQAPVTQARAAAIPPK